tara:strand:- start:621 stop:1085 length:465 start_codon:yes stop_codon:yes gene_type:complete
MNYAEFEATPIKYLSGLSVRARNCIINRLGREATIGDIIAMSDKEMLRVPNFGKKSLRELRLLIEAYALRHNISIAEFKYVRRRLYDALVDGLEMVGERRMVEELMAAIKSAKKKVEIKENLKTVLNDINPSETPFMSVRSNVELNQYEWRTTL